MIGSTRSAPCRFHARFLQQPVRPSPQSQSFSRSYGSNLPISLTYIVLLTRGSSPWRPAADIRYGLARESHRLPRIFTDRRERTGHRGKHDAFRHQHPYRGAIPFQGVQCLKKKRELFPELPPAYPGSFALPLLTPIEGRPPWPGSRNINLIPFRSDRGPLSLTLSFGTTYARKF